MPNSYFNILSFSGLLLIFFFRPVLVFAQTRDTMVIARTSKGQIQRNADSLLHQAAEFVNGREKRMVNRVNSGEKILLSNLERIQKIGLDSVIKTGAFHNKINKIFKAKPLLSFTGGMVVYNVNYRSNIDTPFAEKNTIQHVVNGSLNFSIANFPIRVNYLIRRSNSSFFRDINDVQAEFDVNNFHNQFKSSLQQRLMSFIPVLQDSLLEMEYKWKFNELSRIGDWLNSPMLMQKLIESDEILRMPDNVDTTNAGHYSVLKREAGEFIAAYHTRKEQWDATVQIKDSLGQALQKVQENMAQYKYFISHKLDEIKNPQQLKRTLEKFGLTGVSIPAKYLRLMDIRKLGLGRNQVNYSELTSKNISLTGINFEYNSWYYVALSAGTVDYRFRDFVAKDFNKTPQFMYLARLGIGKLYKNYFIVTAYQGRKQLYASGTTAAGMQSIKIQGFAAEAKIKMGASTYLIAEVAESVSPDFTKNPATSPKFNFKDENSKAFSLKFYSFLPKTNSHIEALYKYTGANFQSFSSFQTNSTVKAWSIKADQQFFKRMLKITASVKSNDFSNPFIVQNYKSNTVFKSLQASFHARHLPIITLGYIPISQLTYVDSLLTENKFQSLNAGLTHFYKIGDRSASSSFIYNRFYNSASDSSFAYYNAENIYFNQTIEFPFYSMLISLSHSKSPGFELNVLDGGLNIKAGRFGNFGFGVKVNDFDKQINESGFYGSLQLYLGKLGILNASYDNGFLPASGHRFIRNEILNINFIRPLN